MIVNIRYFLAALMFKTLLRGMAILGAIFGGLGDLQAEAIAATVQATAVAGGGVQYTVANQSNMTATPFDITLFVVSAADESTNPTIDPDVLPNWIAEPLTAASWEQPMGDDALDLATWHEYTGREFLSWVPGGPVLPSAPVFGSINGCPICGRRRILV